jgi:hypothetical protein
VYDFRTCITISPAIEPVPIDTMTLKEARRAVRSLAGELELALSSHRDTIREWQCSILSSPGELGNFQGAA